MSANPNEVVIRIQLESPRGEAPVDPSGGLSAFDLLNEHITVEGIRTILSSSGMGTDPAATLWNWMAGIVESSIEEGDRWLEYSEGERP